MDSSEDVVQQLLRIERRHASMQRLILQLGCVPLESDGPAGTFRVLQEIRDMFGLSLEGSTATVAELFALIHPDDLPGFLARRQGWIDTGQPLESAVRIIRPGGDIRHLRVIASTDPMDGGRQALLQDVTGSVLSAERENRNEALLGLVSDLAQLGGWRRDLVIGRLDVTGNLHEIFAMPKGEFDLAASLSCYDDVGRADVLAARTRVIRDQVEAAGEYAITDLKGTKKSIRVLQRPILSRDGQTIATVGAIQDISETVALRHQAEARAERLQNTFENMPDGFFLYDRDIRFLYANATGRRMLTGADLQDEDILGRTLWDLCPDLEPSLRARFETLLHDGEPILTLVERGTEIRQVSAHRTPDGLGVHVRDVTQEMRAQRALAESEERHRLALQASRDVIFDWNIEDDVLRWSDAALDRFGYDPKNFPRNVGDWLSILHPDDQERMQHAADISSGPEPHGSSSSEYRLFRADGSIAQVMDRSISIMGPNGRPVRMIGTISDVTEQRRAEERLKQADRLEAIGTLTGGVAHDFNNLLTVVLGNAELLEQNAQLDADSRECAAVILRAAERGAELTAGLLAFAGKQPLLPKTLDTAAALAEVHRLLLRTLPADIALELNIRDDLWLVEADPAQLNAAILNLAVNARDAMPEGGKLLIECSNIHLDEVFAQADRQAKPGDFLRIAVTDTGTGMAPEIAAKVFEPFYTTKPRGAGTGLGLSMVHGFVQQSGGHVSLYTEPGRGTTFSLYLPRSTSYHAEPIRENAAATLDGLGEHVLVVEDNPLLLPHVAQMVQGFGYRVSIAANATEALALLQTGEVVDLLFTDVVMPGDIDGARLAKLATAARPDLKVLFTSGYTEDAIIHHGRLDRGVALLSKPYHRHELARKLREVIDGRV